ncbi:3-keto-5-aminohexanoate cleavage protein [Radicibacter daui]|uniref:3-keto-5-aminohexanoate cleavage protein n=1 Tax=Radicibacter daui TaxID=3064829 RepID=UPI004046FE68
MTATGLPLPTAVAVAPNGGRLTRADHPALPLGAPELARTAAECLEAGASMIHVHVRNGEDRHLLDADAYRQVIAAIRAEVGERLVIQITSEALGLYSPAEQRAVVRATRPEAVSLALRELVPDAAEEPAFADLLVWMKQENVLPQIILYAPEEAERLAGLKKRGLIPWDDIPVLYVLGRYVAGQTSSPADLLPFLASGGSPFSHWSTCAFGRHETACVTAAALLGGHVRVGFENNRLLPDGQVAANNQALVAATVGALRACGLETADAGSWRARAFG